MSVRSKPLAIIIGLAVSTLGLGVVTSAPVAAAAPVWETTFRDDFSGSGLPNPSNWLLTLGTKYEGGPDGFGTGEIETMTNNPNNVDVRNGNLYITPQRDANGAWTSARVESTRANFKPPAGGLMHVESRLQIPNVTGAEAKGYWPAFWMLGSPYRQDRWSWPRIGEFDIMENVQGLNWTYNVLHCGTWGGPCNEPEGINNGKPGNAGEPCLVTTCQAGFHTYGMEWDRSGSSDQLRWYLDGALTFTVNENQVPAQTWADLSDHAGYFVILNVAIGGAFPNKLDGNGGPF
ncbi:MAG TPA: glycoside hydrolase family 16 protein, partial [Pirellulaceae bacterium]